MSRYIDADALIADIQERYCKPCKERKEDYNEVRCRACWVDDAMDEIDGFADNSIDIDLADDGTLSVEVEDATKVKRVLVEDGNNGDLYYADRPQGEWRKHDDERDYCSRCKHIFKTRTITQQDKWTLYIDDLGYNYCPNCGARMKGADDE